MAIQNDKTSRDEVTLSAQDFYNNLALHKEIMVDEGEHSVDGNFNRIEFTYIKNGVTVNGEIGHINDQLFFYFAYTIENIVMDFEYINLANEAESYIDFSTVDAASTRIIFDNGDIVGFEINHKNKSWLFKKLPGQVFPELIDVKVN